VKWAAITFGLVVLQIALGLFAHSAYSLGALHGINAFALFGVALMAGKRVNGVTTTTPAAGQTAAV
jgi:hypothetical protein